MHRKLLDGCLTEHKDAADDPRRPSWTIRRNVATKAQDCHLRHARSFPKMLCSHVCAEAEKRLARTCVQKRLSWRSFSLGLLLFAFKLASLGFFADYAFSTLLLFLWRLLLCM